MYDNIAELKFLRDKSNFPVVATSFSLLTIFQTGVLNRTFDYRYKAYKSNTKFNTLRFCSTC